uniref:Mitochondrial import receptor subunit TOM22 homolog n=1 Tax=Ditylenchus dipsaci TaxID=166011 RepID=A0A915E4H9_9BILA
MSVERNWDDVPDDELEESVFERVEGLKEMFPEGLRSSVSLTVSWSSWLGKETFSLAKSAVWVVSVSAMIMLMPYYIEKEMHDLEKEQTKQQQQMLLGPTAPLR